MGGSSGGSLPSGDLERLEQRAKEKFRTAKDDVNRRVFISFAHEDLKEVNLFRGQAQNEKTELQFDDHSVKEPFDSANADYIRRQILDKIDRCSVTVVYLSNNSAKSKWVNWEIEESIRRGKGVIGAYKGDAPPSNLPTAFESNGCESVKWSHEELKRAIENASTKR